MPNKLWLDITYSRYFLIDFNQDLAEGEFVLVDLDGVKKRADLSEVNRFEVAEADVKEHLQVGLSHAIAQVKLSFSNILKYSTRMPPEGTPRNAFSTLVNESQDASEFLINSLDISPQESRQNPDILKDSFQRLSDLFSEMLGKTISKDLDQAKLTEQEKLHSLQDLLQTYGTNLSTILEEFPDKLNALDATAELPRDDQHPLKELTNKLRELADQIDQSIDKGEYSIDETLLSFASDFKEFFVSEATGKTEEQRTQSYRDIAKESISRSLGKTKKPSINFKDLLPKKSHSQDKNP